MSKSRFKLIPAVYLLLRDGDKILLARRANTGYMDGKYSVPAGHLEGDELATEAMIREANEEIGISLKPEDLRLVHIAHRLSRGEVGQERVDFFFEATTWEGTVINAEPHKCDDVSWFDIAHPPDGMLPFVHKVVSDIQAGQLYSEYEVEPE